MGLAVACEDSPVGARLCRTIHESRVRRVRHPRRHRGVTSSQLVATGSSAAVLPWTVPLDRSPGPRRPCWRLPAAVATASGATHRGGNRLDVARGGGRAPPRTGGPFLSGGGRRPCGGRRRPREQWLPPPSLLQGLPVRRGSRTGCGSCRGARTTCREVRAAVRGRPGEVFAAGRRGGTREQPAQRPTAAVRAGPAPQWQ